MITLSCVEIGVRFMFISGEMNGRRVGKTVELKIPRHAHEIEQQ